MLPTGDIEWPPPALRGEIERVKFLAAEYGGDLDTLMPNSSAVAARRRWWQPGKLPMSGGGTLGWGDTMPLHVPIAADLARTSADLLFSELPGIELATDLGTVASDRLGVLVDALDLESRLPEAAELCAALSGIYWRVSWDTSSSNDPIVSWVQPDNAMPEWSWGNLTAVTFVRKLPGLSPDDKITWRHLERHSMLGGMAVIEHGLYATSEPDNLGRRVPLTEHPETAPLAASLSSEDMIILERCPVMTAGYVPNMRPNRKDRGSPLGRPDIEQLDDLLRAVDITWSSWLRDLRLGRARIIVPREYLTPGAPGQGAEFEESREVYSPLSMMPPGGASAQTGITVSQFAVRTAEHSATLTALVQQIVSDAGYSMRTFGLAGGTSAGAAVTATQIDSEDDLSARTRRKKVRYWAPGLRRLLAAVLSVDGTVLRNGALAAVTPDQVSVTFENEGQPSAQVVAQTANLLSQAKAASTETLVRMVHPDWAPEQVAEEVARIMGEQGVPAMDPATLGAAGSGL